MRNKDCGCSEVLRSSFTHTPLKSGSVYQPHPGYMDFYYAPSIEFIAGRKEKLTRYRSGIWSRSKPKEIGRVLKEGESAPNFNTVDHMGKEVRLSDLRGKKVWLWFFSSPGGSN